VRLATGLHRAALEPIPIAVVILVPGRCILSIALIDYPVTVVVDAITGLGGVRMYGIILVITVLVDRESILISILCGAGRVVIINVAAVVIIYVAAVVIIGHGRAVIGLP